MARIARAVAPGIPHHVTERGNRRQATFFCAEDEIKQFRRHERSGRPLGDAQFLGVMESQLGRALRCGEPGPHPRARP